MSKTLTLEFSDEVYQTLERAAASGRTLEEAALEWRLRQTEHARSLRNGEAQRETAHQHFARHFGAWDSGDLHSADNERIDADLARAYCAA